ncbi:hypothetical protein BDR03DRAFT_974261 [Suillus americanus]|nr:hypothetical protein BDR03DRAFT_974261 [Suillus americanus]
MDCQWIIFAHDCVIPRVSSRLVASLAYTTKSRHLKSARRQNGYESTSHLLSHILVDQISLFAPVSLTSIYYITFLT